MLLDDGTNAHQHFKAEKRNISTPMYFQTGFFMSKTNVFYSISVKAELYLLAWCWRRERRDDCELVGISREVSL